ncbi:FAD-dependent oxidoreductase [Metasolibacillus meyeri]|uniref:FAD-dependent oxidoreductase n=1 Tax=Metasolibacillus meyeri TaxID=1071052 RepID=UPI000D307A6B|nr:FAD-dependent oxidoreductase [Metasolibacillus meyeri]
MKYVIIGGDAAGMSAAMEILRNVDNAEITTLERGEIYSYGQCGLPYVIDGRISSPDHLIARSALEFRKRGIDARIHHEVQKVDFEAQVVKGRYRAEPFTVSYDKLLIATGASPTMPDWEGAHLANIHTVKTIPQMNELLESLQDTRHVTVLGAGYIALEVVEALKSRNLQVRLIHRGKQLMSLIDEQLAEHVLAEAQKHGVEVLLNEQVTGFSGATRVEAVITEQGSYPTDLVIVATGIKPNTAFADKLEQWGNGAIIVDEHMQTSIPNVYAAGDCVAHFNYVKGEYDYVALGTTANKQGRIAGLNMAGKTAHFKGVAGTAILKFFDLAIGMTGITSNDADKLGLAYDVYTHKANHIAGYYPDVQPIYLRMVVEKNTQKLLGLQAVGAGVDKRIDVFATALAAEMTLPELLDIDLSYSPPFNGVWDPLLQIAKRYS